VGESVRELLSFVAGLSRSSFSLLGLLGLQQKIRLILVNDVTTCYKTTTITQTKATKEQASAIVRDIDEDKVGKTRTNKRRRTNEPPP